MTGITPSQTVGPYFKYGLTPGDGHHPNILPISGGKSRSITNGIRCFGAAFVGITASNVLLVI
jgi:hypothetical protein